MVSEWILFALAVLRFWRDATIEAFYKSWSFVGQTREGIMFASLVLLVFFIVLLWRHGWGRIWNKFWEKALEGVVVTLIAFALLFLWKLFAEPWAEVSWARSQMELARQSERSTSLRKDADAAIITQLRQQLSGIIPHHGNADERTVLKREIQKRLAQYINNGGELRDEWSKRLGKEEQIQQQSALAVQAWDKSVLDYLGTIPRGETYQARFRSGMRSSASYPIGINVNIAGAWNLLESDLARLSEFLTDADLGKP